MFFEKDMVSDMVLMKASALGERTKITTLSQELVRRMARCDLNNPKEVREHIRRINKMVAKTNWFRALRRQQVKAKRKEVLDKASTDR